MDRDPLSMLYTLQGEASHAADKQRREASKMRGDAQALERAAVWHEERVAWFQSAIDALGAAMGVDGGERDG